MAEGKKEEKRSIRDSAKSLKKYGSTCNHFKRQDHFVKHVVVEGETLQGIALKYGVTVSISLFWLNSVKIIYYSYTVLTPVLFI
jgi:LysM repeat protein